MRGRCNELHPGEAGEELAVGRDGEGAGTDALEGRAEGGTVHGVEQGVELPRGADEESDGGQRRGERQGLGVQHQPEEETRRAVLQQAVHED